MIVYSTCRTCHGILHVTDGDVTHLLCEDKPTKMEQLLQQWLTAVETGDLQSEQRLQQQIDKLEHQPPRLLEAALCYASWGWPVFPIWEKGHKIGVSITECRCGHNISWHKHLDTGVGKCRWMNEDSGDYCDCQNFALKPILATGKTPATAHGFKDATTDVGRIRAWWGRHPNGNIGVPTGVRFDVIDIDLPDGPESYAQMLTDELIPDVHGQVSTASGGRHLYIEPTGDGCTTRLQPGIDYRGVGGFVVVPPSVLSKGQSWEWVSHPSPMIMGENQ